MHLIFLAGLLARVKGRDGMQETTEETTEEESENEIDLLSNGRGGIEDKFKSTESKQYRKHTCKTTHVGTQKHKSK
jgi:hypothetical protein